MDDVRVVRVPSDPRYTIAVDLVTGTPPDYEVHGRTICDRCLRSCHLGREALFAVMACLATPVCADCWGLLRD